MAQEKTEHKIEIGDIYLVDKDANDDYGFCAMCILGVDKVLDNTYYRIVWMEDGLRGAMSLSDILQRIDEKLFEKVLDNEALKLKLKYGHNIR